MKKVAISIVCIFLSVSIIHGQPKGVPYVILVSFDGFRYDYATRFDAPNFNAFATKGTQAEGLIPSFPSKTFPNHYTLVTGLYPAHHGLVDNSFYDPARQEFYGMKMRDKVIDPYYYGGIPLWQLAKQHHLKSASFFWVGSELPQPELHPDYYFPYDESIPDTARVEQVLKWLRLPEDQRPHFITLYFSSPDHEGHLYGPAAGETRRAVLNADALLARLMTGLQKITLPVNVILVSDHGMLELKQQSETYIFLDEIMDLDDPTVKISNGGTQAHIYVTTENHRDALYRSLKAKAINFSVYKQEEFPAHWHYRTPRSGDILITAHAGYYIRERNRLKYLETVKAERVFGAHGYDAHEVKDMRGIFLAQGPNIRPGLKIPAFENIHIYPFIAKILHLPIPAIDGRIQVLESAYQKE